MNANLIAISVGNTNTRVGTFVDGKLSATHVALSRDVAAVEGLVRTSWEQVKGLFKPAIVQASVNPKPSEDLGRWISANLGTKPLRVERDLKIPIGRHLDRETLVGDDRLLNAAAAYDVLKQSCVVVDAGSAITIDFIDGAGTFHGGAIAPGAAMMLHSLHAGTALLPEVSLQRPEEAIGHNTAEAMRSGVFHGLRGMTRELVEQFAENAGVFPLVVATGGDAVLLFDGWELIDRIVPDLTLQGIAVTWQSSMDEDE
jgi:type III pantothenate kinase